jgi:hypothetical protein
MKKIFTIIAFVLMVFYGYSNAYHTITVDGTINTTSGEYWDNTTERFSTSSGSNIYGYITWDEDYIYVAWPQVDFDGYNQACYIVLDIDPTAKNGTKDLIYEQWYTGSKVTVPFDADLIFMVKENNSSLEEHVYQYYNGNWEKDGANNSSDLRPEFDHAYGNASGNNKDIELRIKKENVGLSKNGAFKIVAYCKNLDDNSGWGYLHRAIPDNGTTDGTGDKTFSHYYGYLGINKVVPNNGIYYDATIFGWTGSTDNDWGTASNWSGSVVPGTDDLIMISSGSVTVDETAKAAAECYDLSVSSGATLTINASKALTVNNSFINNGIFKILSDNTGTGSLIVKNGFSGSGTNTLQRYLTAYTDNSDGWRFLSTPVASFDIAGSDFKPTSGDDDLYSWDETATSLNWINYVQDDGSHPFTQIEKGKGYLTAYKTAGVKTFTGVLNTGSYTANLSYTSTSAYPGWNLIGNPCTSAIDWDELTKSSNVGGTVYVLKADDGTYISWNGSTGSLTDGIIPAMQGFFVSTDQTGESVTISSAAQVHYAGYYKSKRLPDNTLKVSLSNGQTNNETFIQIREDASVDFDPAVDGYKLFGFGTTPEIYTKTGETVYSINCLPKEDALSVPVGLKIHTDGEYTLSLEGTNTFDDNVTIVLEDLKTGELMDVNENDQYSFTFSTSDDPIRFVVHFYNVTAVEDHLQQEVQVYSSGKDIVVKSDKKLKGELTVMSITGQVLIKQNLNTSSFKRINTDLQTGIYIVQIRDQAGNVFSDKVLVK